MFGVDHGQTTNLNIFYYFLCFSFINMDGMSVRPHWNVGTD